MAYKDKHHPSLKAKLALAFPTFLGIVFAIRNLTDSHQINSIVNWILISCIIIFYIRLVICLFVFIQRRVSWFEGITVGLLYGIMVTMFSVWGTQKSFTVDFWNLSGFAFFLAGSIINSFSDYQRHVWKKQAENQGRLYTKGLFRYARHINFFGDSIMFVGFAMVTQNAMSFIPVIFIVLNFILLQIPQLDAYLKNKYGDDFVKYAEKTKIFIPLIY